MALVLWRRCSAALLLAATSGMAGGETLDLNQAMTLALAHSARLRAAEQAASQAGLVARAAGLGPGLTAQGGPLLTDARGLDVDIALTYPLLDATLAPAARAARAAWAAARCEVEEVRLEVMAGAAAAWFEVANATRRRAALDQDLALARALAEAAAKAREVGERPGIDVLRAELEVGLAEQALAEAQADATVAAGALALLLGGESAAPPTVTASWPAISVPDRPALVRQVAQRPRLRAASLRVEEARALVAQARAQRSPTVAVAGFREDQEQGLRVSVELPLFDSGRIRAEVAAAEAAAQRGEAELNVAQRDAERSFDAAWVQWMAAEQRRAGYASGVLARAERLAELASQGYAAGELSMIEVTDSRRRLAEARLNQARLDAAWSSAFLALQSAVGANLMAAPLAPQPAPAR